MRAPAAVVVALLTVTACASGARNTGRLSPHADISALQATLVPMRNGASGAPVDGVRVSGTIENAGSSPLRCGASTLLLVDGRGDATWPASAWCDVPAIAPQNSANFNAIFTSLPGNKAELRFEHGDGTYEAHDLALPPA